MALLSDKILAIDESIFDDIDVELLAAIGAGRAAASGKLVAACSGGAESGIWGRAIG